MRRDILMVLLIAGIAGVLYFYKKEGISGILPVTPPATPKETPLAEFSFPADFSARVAELDALAEMVGRNSATYKAAIDQAFEQVSGTLGSGEVIAWSSAKGYYVISHEEARTMKGW